MSIKPKALRWLWLAAAVIVLDQLSKAWVVHALHPGQMVPLIPGLLYDTLTYNTGAAFSFLAGGSGWQRWLFTALALSVSAALVVWLARTPRRDWRSALPLALVLGGAVGNLIDRVAAARVTDFILVFIGSWPFPAFNIADSAISVGAVMLVLFGLFARPSAGSCVR